MTLWISLMLIVYTFACLFLIFVILIQSGKGGGLSSLGSANQGISDALGATGAEKTLNRMTTYCAIGFMVLAILLSIAGSHQANKTQQFITEQQSTQAEQPLTGTIPGAEGLTTATATTTAPAAATTAPATATPAEAAPVATEATPAATEAAPAVTPAPATEAPATPAPEAPAAQ